MRNSIRVLSFSLSRAALQLAAISTTIILGRFAPNILAPTVIGLAYSALGFAIIVWIPLGAQPELVRARLKGHLPRARLLTALLTLTTAVGVVLTIIYFVVDAKLILGTIDPEVLESAQCFSRILAISIPIMGATTVFWTCIEAEGGAAKVTKYRTTQAFTQISLVIAFICLPYEDAASSAPKIAYAIVLNDIIYFLIVGRLFMRTTKWKLEKFSTTEILLCSRISILMAGSAVLDRGRIFFLTILFSGISHNAIAAYSLGRSCVSLALIPIGGFCASLSLDIAAGKITKSSRLIGDFLFLVMTLGTIIFLILRTTPTVLTAIYAISTILNTNAHLFVFLLLAEGVGSLSTYVSRGIGVYARTQAIYWIMIGSTLLLLKTSAHAFSTTLAIYSCGALSAAITALLYLYMATPMKRININPT